MRSFWARLSRAQCALAVIGALGEALTSQQAGDPVQVQQQFLGQHVLDHAVHRSSALLWLVTPATCRGCRGSICLQQQHHPLQNLMCPFPTDSIAVKAENSCTENNTPGVFLDLKTCLEMDFLVNKEVRSL